VTREVEAEDGRGIAGGGGGGGGKEGGGLGHITRGMMLGVPFGSDIHGMLGIGRFSMSSVSSLSSMSILGGTSPTASRRGERMEPYLTLQGLADPRMSKGSSGVGTKRRRSTNRNPDLASSQSSQSQVQTQGHRHSLSHTLSP
jgi:hypothetical protein